jgi:hypothetical protein
MGIAVTHNRHSWNRRYLNGVGFGLNLSLYVVYIQDDRLIVADTLHSWNRERHFSAHKAILGSLKSSRNE